MTPAFSMRILRREAELRNFVAAFLTDLKEDKSSSKK
jgi:hypothetical protein